MNTPLQQAAQAILARWDAPASTQQILTGEHIYEQLRKALDAELAQVVEPVAWTLTKTIDAGETTTTAYLWFVNPINTSWTPLYLHPPQPKATTSLPAEVLEAIRRSGHALVKTKFGYRLNFIGAATAQGEKP